MILEEFLNIFFQFNANINWFWQIKTKISGPLYNAINSSDKRVIDAGW